MGDLPIYNVEEYTSIEQIPEDGHPVLVITPKGATVVVKKCAESTTSMPTTPVTSMPPTGTSVTSMPPTGTPITSMPPTGTPITSMPPTGTPSYATSTYTRPTYTMTTFVPTTSSSATETTIIVCPSYEPSAMTLPYTTAHTTYKPPTTYTPPTVTTMPTPTTPTTPTVCEEITALTATSKAQLPLTPVTITPVVNKDSDFEFAVPADTASTTGTQEVRYTIGVQKVNEDSSLVAFTVEGEFTTFKVVVKGKDNVVRGPLENTEGETVFKPSDKTEFDMETGKLSEDDEVTLN